MVKRNFFKHLLKGRKVHKNLNNFWKSGYREDLGFSVRSGWEANYARWLNHMGYTYKFEPRMFPLSNGTYYLPDFYVNDLDLYIELKGWEMKKGIDKYNQFKKDYPTIKIKFVGASEYRSLAKDFKKHIPNWE